MYLPFALSAYFLNGIAVLTDKYLLTNKVTNPLIYIFYISFFSLFILILSPFVKTPDIASFVLASISTILWTTGLYFMYKALQVGLVTRVIPLIGAFIPIILLFEAFLSRTITQSETIAVVTLILGLVFLTIFEWRGKITTKELSFEVISALFFAFSYVFLREAYIRENFLTILVYSRMVLIPVGITILIAPALRKIVFESKNSSLSLKSKTGLLFLSGQAAGEDRSFL